MKKPQFSELIRGGTTVVGGGVEPPTYRFSGGRSYQLSYPTGLEKERASRCGTNATPIHCFQAVLTGFEPAAFTLTG